MADTPISGLTAVTTPDLTDEFPVNQGGVTKKVTRAQLLDTERYLLRADAGRTFTNVTTRQAIFASGQSTLTLPLGTYRFECMLYVTGMSTTSGNLQFDWIGAGTAVGAAWLYHAVGIDVAAPTTAAAQTGSFGTAVTSAAQVVTGTTAQLMGVRVEGMFEVTTAGTVIPSILLTNAAAANLQLGSYFWAERVSTSTSLTGIGPVS